MIAWPVQEAPVVQVLNMPEDGGMIGRGEGCALSLPDSGRLLSRHHGEIVIEEGRYQVRNWSRNGLILNGQEVSVGVDGQRPIADGDLLELGEYQLLVSQPPVAASVIDEPRDVPLVEDGVFSSAPLIPVSGPVAPPVLTDQISASAAHFPRYPREPDGLPDSGFYDGNVQGHDIDAMLFSNIGIDNYRAAHGLNDVDALADEVLREFSPERLQHKLGPWRGKGWRKQSWWVLYGNYHAQLQRTQELHVRLREWFLRAGGLGGS